MNIDRGVLQSGFDYKKCWVAPSVSVNMDNSLMVWAMSRLDLTGSDVFEGTYCAYSRDQGTTWTEPALPEVFAKRQNSSGGSTCYEVVPRHHRQTGSIVAFGGSIHYTAQNELDHNRPRGLIFSMLDQSSLEWSPPMEIDLPEEICKDFTQPAFQVVELANGEFLFPLAITYLPNLLFTVYVVRIRVEGGEARIIEYGSGLDQIKQPRGLYEPSLINFGNRYFMSLRNDIAGYVTVSEDGVNYANPKPWCFDNGELLGNYNTQQRWVRHADRGLYLIYTRRNADNDNVFRHRGPVMIARVDTERLCVIRETEQVLVPNRGARMGNFMVTEISPDRSCFTVAEWMQNDEKGYGRTGAEYCASFGSDNSVFYIDITW